MRSWITPHAAPQRIGILLFNAFSMHCLANTVEPLRAANGLVGRRVYDWQFLTMDGLPVTSSSGLRVEVHGRLASSDGHLLVVMPSYRFRDYATPEVGRGLRMARARYSMMAGFDTGSWLLAYSRVLMGRRATIHHEEFDSFAETFPDVRAVRERVVFDDDFITCGGVVTAFEAIMELIGRHHGEALRLEVATLFMSPEATRAQPVATARGKTVARAIRLMQEHLEDPLTIAEVARRIGRSQKELSTRTRDELGATPQAVYRRLRLILARKLVSETDLTIAEIALRTGYDTPSAMTRAFREEFGVSPRQIRSN